MKRAPVQESNGDDLAIAASRRQSVARLRFALLVAVFLPTAAFFAVAAFMLHRAFADADEGVDAAARIAQQHVHNLLETNRMLLARIHDLVGDAPAEVLLDRGPDLHARLREMAGGMPQVQLLSVHGADSRAIAMSRLYPPPRHIDYSDREWYTHHRDAIRPTLYISQRLTSRATGEAIFDMSLGRVFAGGTFAGTVHVSLRPEYLTAFFSQIATTVPGLQIQVLRRDGQLLARFPGTPVEREALAATDPLARAMGSGGESGRYAGVQPSNGRDSLGAFRRLPDYPVYVSASVGRGDILAAWAKQAGLLALFVLPMSLALWWIGASALRRGLQSMQRLDEEIERRQQMGLALAHSQKLEAMGRLTGGIAHEFNNVLSVISVGAHLVRRLVPPGTVNDQLDAIDRAVVAATRLTRQLLGFTRRQALAPAPLSLQERLPALVNVLRPLLGDGIELVLEIDPDTRPAFADAAEFELALINVALNARDAMEGGRGRLHIRARNAAPGEAGRNADFVVIDATDNGKGIDAAIVGRVLEPFFTTKPPGQGSGLGLAQVQAFCESSGGKVQIGPHATGGTRVSLYLGTAEAVVEPASKDSRRASGEDHALDCEVLLVEDNSAVGESTMALLQSFGCRVRRSVDADDALRSLATAAVDIVLSDVEMPGSMDGIGLAAVLGQQQPGLPVLLITGYASRLDEARRQGLNVLAKPCAPQVLRQAIEKALASRSDAQRARANQAA